MEEAVSFTQIMMGYLLWQSLAPLSQVLISSTITEKEEQWTIKLCKEALLFIWTVNRKSIQLSSILPLSKMESLPGKVALWDLDLPPAQLTPLLKITYSITTVESQGALSSVNTAILSCGRTISSLITMGIKGVMFIFGIFKTQLPLLQSYLTTIIWEFMLRIKEEHSTIEMTQLH